jgi:poly(A) polymerase
MLRAVALAARLDFSLDPPVLDAIRAHRQEIARSSPARLLEEYYKILRGGYAEKIFRGLGRAGLLEPISAELHQGASDPLWQSLAALDVFRLRHESVPEGFTNTVLLGSLLVPLGLAPQAPQKGANTQGLRLGSLPLARRDVERLQQIMSLQRRLRDVKPNPRAQRALIHRSVFRDGLAWMEIHGNSPEVVAHWRAITTDKTAPPGADGTPAQPPTFGRRRRRRRRRPRPAPQS